MQFAYSQVDFIWGKQIGSDQDDKTRNLVADTSGNVYVVGKTLGKLGERAYGKSDGFIFKVDSTGRLLWIRQIGSKKDDELKHADVDLLGNLYVTGYICPNDSQRPEDSDILIMKFDTNGQLIWKQTYGTNAVDKGENIVVDKDGSIYVTGSTKGIMTDKSFGQDDCFILHLNTDGKLINTVQFGTVNSDTNDGITIGKDNLIYVCGTTKGNLAARNAGEFDLFWGSFSKDLKQLSMHQAGTDKDDYASEIKTDTEGNVYIAGSTLGNLGAQQLGDCDAFIQRWNNRGSIVWTRQFGTINWDGAHSICVLQNMGVLISGCQNYPKCQSFCKMYDENGSLLWDRYFTGQGEGGGTCGKDICTDNKGHLYHAGYTGANLFSGLKGKHDLFLMKYKFNF